MLRDITFLLASLGAILAACFFFTNAVEWLGNRLKLGHGAVGSVLAAVGTALPETIIPIIAVFFFRGEAAGQIAVGAIAGAPFMLGTLAFFVTGAAVGIYALFGKREMKMNASAGVISRDLTFFIIVYGAAIAAVLLKGHENLKIVVGIALLLSYAFYVKITFSDDKGQATEEPEELYFSRFFKADNSTGVIIAQLVLSLVVLVGGADFFVNYTSRLSALLDMPPLILSILITPIATELPEKLNSIIWIGKKKDTLAMGNITGAMVFQSCFPVVFGIIFTPWDLRGTTLLSAAFALGSALLNLVWIKVTKSVNAWVLMATGAAYFVFLAWIFIK
jgi:cation:H+ antiporter